MRMFKCGCTDCDCPEPDCDRKNMHCVRPGLSRTSHHETLNIRHSIEPFSKNLLRWSREQSAGIKVLRISGSRAVRVAICTMFGSSRLSACAPCRSDKSVFDRFRSKQADKRKTAVFGGSAIYE